MHTRTYDRCYRTRRAAQVADIQVDFINAIWKGGVGAFGEKRLVKCRPSTGAHLSRQHATARSQCSAASCSPEIYHFVTKILRYYRENLGRQSVPYHVPFHEFTKSVMLADYRFYRDGRSEILNLFALSGVAPNSHFTAIRMLAYLMEISEGRSAFGTGYIEITAAARRLRRAFFKDVQDSAFSRPAPAKVRLARGG